MKEEDILILLKRLLENTNVNFLLGAGASKVKVEGTDKPFPLMVDLLQEVRNNTEITDYYSELKTKENDSDSIYYYLLDIYEKDLFGDNSNIEEFLSKLEGILNVTNEGKIFDEVTKQTKITKTIILERIKDSDIQSALKVYNDFYNSLIIVNKNSEKSNHKKFNIFTTNYDMLNEASMEELKLYYYSGFHGIYNRTFNMAYYNYSYTDTIDLYGNKYYEKTNYINLYKLHGSLSWKETEKDEEKILTEIDYRNNEDPIIIYPSMTKYNLTNLIVYYQSLLREFSGQLKKPNSTLFVIGNSLGDQHLVKIIEDALDLEYFNLVILSYSNPPLNSVIRRLSERKNVYSFYGANCTLSLIASLYKSGDNFDINEVS